MPAPSAHADAACTPPSRAYVSPAVRSLLGLPPGACRWPLAGAGGETGAFCGAPRQGRSSYCALHRALSREARP